MYFYTHKNILILFKISRYFHILLTTNVILFMYNVSDFKFFWSDLPVLSVSGKEKRRLLMFVLIHTKIKNSSKAGRGDSHLYSQHFGRLRWVDHLRSGVWDQPGQHNETVSLLKKIQKTSQAWWHTPVIPATQEAEARESLEYRRQRLQWAEITHACDSSTQEAEAGMNCDRATALQPGQQSETLSQNKQAKNY